MNAWIETIVQDMGYIGLVLLTFLENIFPPLPSEVIMPLGGFLAAQGQLNLVGVILAGTLGSLAGALPLYYLGKYLHEDRLKGWLDERGQWLLLTPDDIEQADNWFDRHGTKAVFFCRLIPGVRSLISIPAGSSGMKMLPFLLYTSAGTALWSTILAVAGQMLGEQYGNVGAFLRWTTYVVVALFLLSVIWFVVQRRTR